MGEIFTMEITGLDETLNKLKGLAGKGFSTELLVPAMRLVGEDIVGEAKSYCDKGNTHFYRPPHITGNLMRSISYIVTPQERIIWLTIGCGVEYGPWVHEGNGRMAPRPFLTDAVAARKGNANEIILQGIMTAIRKFA
jgi:hypothetical protein